MPNARNHGPAFTSHDAERIASEFYRLHTTARPLPGERDYNFYLHTPSGEEYVLKIAHAEDQRALLDMQHQALKHLAKREPSLALPQVRHTYDGEAIATTTSPTGTAHLVRLLTYVPGKLLAAARPHTDELLSSLGNVLGKIDRGLSDFAHPAAQRSLKWDL